MSDRFERRQLSKDEWLRFLQPLGVKKGHFNKNRLELFRMRGTEPPVNEVARRILESLARKYRRKPEMLSLVQQELARLAASEAQDPSQFLD